jgi:drug/metabolite transporter (DMT)-like permease
MVLLVVEAKGMSRINANLLLLLTGAIWGMAFVAQSSAMDSVGPLLFVGLRSVLAAVVLLPFAFIESSNRVVEG